MARGGDGLHQGGRTWSGAVLAGLVIALPAQAAAECLASRPISPMTGRTGVRRRRQAHRP
jgi:hypothetical protein